MRRWIWMALLVAGAALSAAGAFVHPTDAQLDQAAREPARIKALIKEASPEQAAQVVKAVILRIMARPGAPAADDAGRAQIARVVALAFATMPADQTAVFAAALGAACGGSLLISSSPAVVSIVQGALATGGANEGAALAACFAKTYTVATAPPGSVGVQGQNQNQAPPPIRPPTAALYPGQE